MSTSWHRFIESDGDDLCERCSVVVTTEALLSFTLPCPAGYCPAPSNPDDGCVFVPSRSEVPRCIYCGKTGGRPHDVAGDAS